jgi:hypothetical protein
MAEITTSAVSIQPVSSGSGTEGSNIATMIGGLIVLLLIFGIIYWYNKPKFNVTINNFKKLFKQPILPDANQMLISTATYGGNCDSTLNNNVKYQLSKQCDNTSDCYFRVDNDLLGDPSPGCSKNLRVMYTCTVPGATNPQVQNQAIFYQGDSAHLSCKLPINKVSVMSASYGIGCNPQLVGNVGHSVRTLCDNKSQCSIKTDVATLGDPGSNSTTCINDLTVFYKCRPNQQNPFTKTVKSPDTMNISCAPNSV